MTTLITANQDEAPVFDIFPSSLRAELEARAKGFKWSAQQCQIIADICDWRLAKPNQTPDYEDAAGEPNAAMRALIKHVQDADCARRKGTFTSLVEKASRTSRQAERYVIWQRDYAEFMRRPKKVSAMSQQQVLASFGASQCVLHDTQSIARPKLYSVWDRRPAVFTLGL